MQKSASKILEEIHAKFGNVVGFASDKNIIEIPRISGGSLKFDVAMYGGFPCAAISSIVGWESTGKSLLLYRTMAAAQQTCRHCHKALPLCAVNDKCGAQEPIRVGLVATEQYYADWAARHGVENDCLYLIDAPTLEACTEISEALLANDAIDLLCWDSMACANTEHSLESHISEQSTFIMATLYATFLKRVNVMLATKIRNKAIICINQWRDDIKKNAGKSFNDPNAKRRPGGATQKFTDSVLVDMTFARTSNNKESVTANFFIRKNKTAPPLKKGNFTVFFEGARVDNEDKIYLNALMANEILTKENGNWKLREVNTSFANRKEIENFFQEHPHTYYLYRDEIIKTRKLIPTKGCTIDDMNFDEEYSLSKDDLTGEDGEQYELEDEEETEASW